MPKRIGILGGTFDPIHIGHLRTAEEALETLRLDSFVFLPAAVPPHKTAKPILAFRHRWNMLDLAIAGNARFQALDLEYHLSGKSYTVRSLEELHRYFQDDIELFFLLGLDAFLEIHTWWHYKALFNLAQLVVMRRPSYREEDLERELHSTVSDQYHWDAARSSFVHPTLLPVHFLRVTYLDVSSTKVRELVAQGRSIRYLVPPKVIGYIEANHLYGTAGRSSADQEESLTEGGMGSLDMASFCTKTLARGEK